MEVTNSTTIPKPPVAVERVFTNGERNAQLNLGRIEERKEGGRE